MPTRPQQLAPSPPPPPSRRGEDSRGARRGVSIPAARSGLPSALRATGSWQSASVAEGRLGLCLELDGKRPACGAPSGHIAQAWLADAIARSDRRRHAATRRPEPRRGGKSGPVISDPCMAAAKGWAHRRPSIPAEMLISSLPGARGARSRLVGVFHGPRLYTSTVVQCQGALPWLCVHAACYVDEMEFPHVMYAARIGGRPWLHECCTCTRPASLN